MHCTLSFIHTPISFLNIFFSYFILPYSAGIRPKKKLDLNLGYANFTQFKNLFTWVLCKIICFYFLPPHTVYFIHNSCISFRRHSPSF